MNQHRHRIIFNAARGQLMVVSETASAQGKDASGQTSPVHAGRAAIGRVRLSAMGAALSLLVGLSATALFASAAQAQIVPDPSAPGNQRPTVLAAPNGAPVVNIQTPSAAGVSRNTYSQFDVNSNGAVLNNSRSNAQTQLGGWVQGNPWLATGSARVILNEVNSANPSQLRGFIEVAGQRAEVVIANPAGLHIDGAGFINTSRATLTTGTPVMNGGSLESYRVQRGVISLNGAGLDATLTDHTGILARAIAVNAGLWANQLQVVAGDNTVSAAQDAVQAHASGSGPAPGFALDVSEIGGMYAGKIRLVGTEAGVGVRHAGTIAASSGRLTLDASGWLSNSGRLQAREGMTLSAQGPLTNSGEIFASQSLSLSSTDAIRNTGRIDALGDLDLGALSSDNSGRLAAGANLRITTHGQQRNSGEQVSAADLSLRATDIDNQGGQIQALGDITALAATALDNRAGLMRAGHALSLQAASIQNQNTRHGDLGLEGGSVSLQALHIDNTTGAVRAQGDLAIASAGQLGNAAGLLSAGNTLGVNDPVGTGAQRSLLVDNHGGTLVADQAVQLSAQRLDGVGSVLSAGDVTLALAGSHRLEVGSEVVANHTLRLELGGDLLNSGSLRAGQALQISAQNTVNTASGDIASAGNTAIDAAQTLTNRGLIDGQATRIHATSVHNIGTGRIYGAQVAIAAQHLLNDTETVNAVRTDAVIAARNRLDIGVQTLTNREGATLFSAGDLAIGGALDAHSRATGQAQTIDNNSATIESLGNMALASDVLRNTNEHFSTALVAVGSPESRFLIQPAGSAARYSASSFVWVNWSRAGLYRFVGMPAGSTGILGQTEIARVGEQSCSGGEPNEVCSLVNGAEYPSTDPAWAWFNLTPPDAAPSAPTLATPVAPDPASASACEAGAGYNASACGAYNTALSQYTADQAAFIAAWNNHHTAHAAWQADTEARRDTLDAQIETYNAGFANPGEVKSWTQYLTTVSSSQSAVTQSDPGQILAGGNMRLGGGSLVNDKSRIIAGGALSGDLHNLSNLQAEGVHITHETGTSQYTRSRWRGGFKRYQQRDWDPVLPYTPPDTVNTITLSVARIAQNTTPQSSGIQPGALTTAASVATAAPTGSAAANTTLPSSALFRPAPDSTASYLIETDPRFANYRQWLSSDYLLQALSIDPATTQKRLGDGFYEQRLISEQIASLTGQRFLGDFTDPDTQYLALMTAGATFARAQQLRPGVALSAEQVALLTSDIVWLVEREVTLADGSKTQALVPQVYAVPRPGDLNGSGALMAASEVNINLSGDLANAGSIAGRRVTQINAQNIRNIGGSIQGAITALSARQDISNTGGTLQGQDALLLQAGGDVNLATTTQSASKAQGASSFSRTTVDRVAALYVSNPGGTLQVLAGQDITAQGAQINNVGASGTTRLQAGRNLNLTTVETAMADNSVRNANNALRQSSSQEVGSSINAGGAIQISAQNDVNLRAAQVNAQDTLSVGAGGNVNIQAGQSSESFEEARQHTSKGFASSKTTTSRSSSQSTTAQASELGGQTVAIQSGADTRISGSNVIADQNLSINAVGNVSITAAQNTQTSSAFTQTTKSGLMSGGGLSLSIGRQSQSLDQQGQSTTAAASTVGSVGGNVSLSAGQTYTQTGSDVLSPGGDVNISAQSVNIQEARETSTQSSEQKFKQSGLTLAITSPVITALQAANSQIQAAGNTSSNRMQALAGANIAFNASQAANAVQAGQGDANGMIKGADGNLVKANAADQAGGIGISISLGASKSQSKQSSQSDTARGSQIAAGGNVNIQASGAGQNSDITIQGSSIQAGQTTSLKAEGDVNLLAAANTTTESNSSKSSSGSIGVGFQLGAGGAGIGVTASAARGTGQGAGSGTSTTNTQVSGQRVDLESGGDTTLRGAVVSATQVTADVGANLSIESLQDQNQYKESSKSAGGSVTFGAGAGGSVNLSKSSINSNFQSVGEQSAIRAGDGGFAVNVQGDTALTGGQITSTQAAIDQGKNSFATGGTLSTTDLQNSASYQANSASIGVGTSGGKVAPSGVGIGSDEGSASSTTTAGISGIAGNTAARTGDQQTGIAQIFDVDKVKKEIEAQVTITQEFNKQAGKAITDYADGQRKALQEQAKNAATPEEKAKAEQAIKDVNMQERALNILTSALTGMAGSVITKEALSTAAEKMRDLMIEDSKKFAGVVDSTGRVLSNVGGPSDGVRGDGVKVGGTRVDLDLLCGASNERCAKNSDGSLALNQNKEIQFIAKDAAGNPMTINQFLTTPDGKKLIGPTGGVQGMVGTMFGVPYAAGSWMDRLVESFAGPHDYIGGGFSGLYDEQGNARRGMSELESKAYDVWSGVAIPVAAPFAAADGVSRDVWQAIHILLRAAR